MARRAAIVAFALAALSVRHIAGTFADLPFAVPFQSDYEEGNLLNALSRIADGATPYPDPHALPNVINPYGPVAYYLLFLPVAVFGVGFPYARAMILGCTLLVVALIAFELRRRTRSTPLALAFGLYFLTIPNVQNWAWLLRVDMLGIVFTVGGLLLFARRLDRDEGPGALPGLLFAAGLLVKPTLVAAPAACFVALVARRRFREAAKLAAVTAAAFGVVMGLFAAWTHGAVLVDVFLSHPEPYSLNRYLVGLAKMSRRSWPLVLLAAVAAANDTSRRRISLPMLWFLTATATTATMGNPGSNFNHFLEWDAALCLTAGIGMGTLLAPSSRAVAVASAVAVAAAMAYGIRKPREVGDARSRAGCLQAYDWVRVSAGPNLLTENVGALVLGHKRIWVSNPYVLAQMVEHAGWSDADLVRMVRERRFDAIIVKQDYPADPTALAQGSSRFSPGLLQALAANYAPETGFACLDMDILFKPRLDAPAARIPSPAR